MVRAGIDRKARKIRLDHAMQAVAYR